MYICLQLFYKYMNFMTNTTTVNTPIIRDAINVEARKNEALINDIAKHTGKNPGSVRRWFYSNDSTLLRVDILAIISRHLNKPLKELI